MTFGEQAEWLERARAADPSMRCPSLDARPVLDDDLVWLHRVFCTLSASRPYGMSAMPIPYSEMLAALDEEGIDDAFDRRRAISLIQSMDAEYLKIVNAPKEGKK